jgi:hypothetical protein
MPSSVRAGQLAHAVDGELPQRAVVDLERVVPAVLARPDLHVVGAQLADDPGGLVHQVERRLAYARIGVGEGSPAEPAQVDLRRDADGRQALRGERVPHLAEADAGGERVVEIDHGQVLDLPGQLDGVERGAGRAVAVGGVPVDVGGEVPEAGAEAGVHADQLLSWAVRARATASRQAVRAAG